MILIGEEEEYMFEIETAQVLFSLLEMENETGIYIYGAGRIGILVGLILREKNIRPIAYIESEKIRRHIYGINVPVISFSEFPRKNNGIIIVAASMHNKEEILRIVNPENVLIVSDTFYFNESSYFDKLIDRIIEQNEIVLYRNIKNEKEIYDSYFNNEDDCSLSSHRMLSLLSGLEETSCNILIDAIKFS